MRSFFKGFLPLVLVLLLAGCSASSNNSSALSDTDKAVGKEEYTDNSSYNTSENTTAENSNNDSSEMSNKPETGSKVQSKPGKAGTPSREKQENNTSSKTAETPKENSQKAESQEENPYTYTASDKQGIFNLVNKYRAENGLAALTYRSDLDAVADIRAREIREYFSHTRPNGTSCFTAISEAGIGYQMVGENIAYGYRNADSVMTGWMNSEGHRRNILEPDFTGMAVGEYAVNGVKYHVQIFIR